MRGSLKLSFRNFVERFDHLSLEHRGFVLTLMAHMMREETYEASFMIGELCEMLKVEKKTLKKLCEDLDEEESLMIRRKSDHVKVKDYFIRRTIKNREKARKFNRKRKSVKEKKVFDKKKKNEEEIIDTIKKIGKKIIVPTKGERLMSASMRRENFFKELQASYHPEKAYMQVATAKSAYIKTLTDESKKTNSPKEKGLIEANYHKKVLDFIKSMRNTRAWIRQSGRFLPGLGTLMKNKPWEAPKMQAHDEIDSRAKQLEKLKQRS